MVLVLGVSKPGHAIDTSFTYQGELKQNGINANGTFDFQFRLFVDESSGTPSSSPLPVDDVVVTDGLFTVELDFGAVPLSPLVGNRWLEIEVRPGASGGGYTTLSPRQKLTAAPYALGTRGMRVSDSNLVGFGDGFVSGLDVAMFRSGLNNSNPSANMGVHTRESGTNPPEGFIYLQTDTNEANLVYDFGDRFALGQATSIGGFLVEFITILPNGNIGMGEINPQNKLHVREGSAGAIEGNPNAPLVVERASSSYIDILSPSANERGVLFSEPGLSPAGGIVYNAAATPDGLQFRSNGNVIHAVITSTGNVGLGTINPTRRLDLGGGDIEMGYEVVEETSASEEVVTVACPPGKAVLGGGCAAPFATSVDLESSTPTDNNGGWHCHWDESDGDGLTAIAICANMR